MSEKHEPRERTWDERIFELIDPGVDGTLIDANLKRTPTERILNMIELLRFREEALKR